MNAPIPRPPLRLSAVSVRACTRITPAYGPLVTHALVPLRIQSSPSRTACVDNAAASEPASGSESAKAPSNSPRAIGLRKRCFWSSLPKVDSICVGSELWTLIITATDASAAAISSSATRYVTVSSASPSYSSAVNMPRNPRSPSFLTSVGSKYESASHCLEYGTISAAAKSRATRCISRCSSVSGKRSSILVESASCLASQPARRDVLLEERTGAILRIAKSVVHDLQDRDTGVESYEVSESERAHGMVHSELHHRVDSLGRANSLHHAIHSLVDHRHEDAIRNETGIIAHLDRRLAEGTGKRNDLRRGLVRRRQSANDLDQLHHRHRIHEVHPDDLFRTPGLRRNLRYGDGARVGRENCVRLCKLVEIGEDPVLERDILCRRLHDQRRVTRSREVGRERDVRQGRILRCLIDGSLLQLPIEILLDRSSSTIERALRHVDHRDGERGRGKDVRDPVSHLTSADYGDLLIHLHDPLAVRSDQHPRERGNAFYRF